MEGFSWIAEMKDGMSGPANEARKSLAALRGEMRATDEALLRISRDQLSLKKYAAGAAGDLRRQADALRQSRGELKFQADGIDDTRSRWASMAGSMFRSFVMYRLVLGTIREIKDALVGAVDLAADFVVEGSKMAILAVESRQHMLRAFTGGAEGNEEIGAQTYDMVMRLRRELPQSQKEIANWVSTLQGAGMVDPSGLVQTVKAMAAASALMGGGAQGDAAANKVKEIMARASEMGAFKIRGGLRGFVGTGISPDDLSKALGMTPAQLNVAFTKGTVPVERGMAAIEEILTTKGGKALEGTMREWDVIMAKGKESVSHLFDDVETGPFMEMMRDTGDMLDKDQQAGAALNTIFKEIFGATFDLGTSALVDLRVGFTYLEIWVLRNKGAIVGFIHDLKGIKDVTLDALTLSFQGLGLVLDSITPTIKLLYDLVTLLPKAALDMAYGGAHANTPAEWAATHAPAHAAGGRVMKPAAGEYFASVAPGETIVPSDRSRAASALELGGEGGRTSLAQHNEMHFHGVKGADEARDLMVDALADVLEQAALEGGR